METKDIDSINQIKLIEIFGNQKHQDFIFFGLILLESGPLKLCPEISQDFNWNIFDIPKQRKVYYTPNKCGTIKSPKKMS